MDNKVYSTIEFELYSGSIYFRIAVKRSAVLDYGDGKLQSLLYIMQLPLSSLSAQKLGLDGRRDLSIIGISRFSTRSWVCVYYHPSRKSKSNHYL
ncbi:hypothetical protein CY34DRAFT_811076 [Suillus luteus UH-Slu-Lm8-n1]|uniref:Uncharacterized protein n=1 Tax=Suillus luteus UH-Slu-Lm8-n1 TaxID=930992 RepID=A0A0D0AF07_9AGAM|nr:hypothetical protein CY34DRAFT_811076 [Suillus luteus UH-Slu-Lm8-n1]